MPHRAAESSEPVRPLSRGEARRRAFLDAAADAFLEHGFEAASVNEIVRRAGGSLATLYQQFGSKEQLFQAAVEERVSRAIAPMVHAADHNLPIRQGLQAIGEAFLGALVSPGGVAIFRVSIGEARKFPEVMRTFLLTGPDRVRQVVSAYLAARAPQDGCSFASVERAADYFCEMVRGRYQYRALADPSFQLSQDDIRVHVAAAVDFFVRGAGGD
ncbi:MAG: TetR/AcrR family transcriptional regulator [Hydrogenophilaceae bacterium]|nr:TetR/AcrR family transcriptional regulator [Hydrogenophilaceae bacterium]